jgi:hypothetical protein
MTKAPLKKTNGTRTALKVPEVLKIIGEESRRNGTDRLIDSQIGKTIKARRKQRRKKRGLAGEDKANMIQSIRNLPLEELSPCFPHTSPLW